MMAILGFPDDAAAKPRSHASARDTMVATGILAAGAVPSLSGGGAWLCKASGYGGVRNVWQTVTGPLSATRAEAEANALRECRLNACRPSGCWQR